MNLKMTLKELKQMIAEEYAAYKNSIKEQGPIPSLPKGPGVAVSDKDIDASGDKDAEKTLKNIFDMLQDFFNEDDKEDDAADDAAGDAADDAADDAGDDAEDDLEEGHGMYDEDEKEEKNESTSGVNSGYSKVQENKNKIKAVIKEAHFKSRLQRLANIKK